ncbi:hypothetical protein P152DRAFT_513271 [Eremomyces bilateralis CBS 781.70]|uniref:F-box domain-containing protein n=1 Tax=Eremomyces bilateralis CBS 781.70 TaxID=1392243 RepID=A0A6G1G7A2_9PEZI|nr:uncharacterized protein P152DRAFT_513271 [Eremomyces bilateralis CBS 781.70]KAF1813928.1 hypothetical protein P152DRAFT_513271 [Eremomyces bilateralis CBS 781.70]
MANAIDSRPSSPIKSVEIIPSPCRYEVDTCKRPVDLIELAITSHDETMMMDTSGSSSSKKPVDVDETKTRSNESSKMDAGGQSSSKKLADSIDELETEFHGSIDETNSDESADAGGPSSKKLVDLSDETESTSDESILTDGSDVPEINHIAVSLGRTLTFNGANSFFGFFSPTWSFTKAQGCVAPEESDDNYSDETLVERNVVPSAYRKGNGVADRSKDALGESDDGSDTSHSWALVLYDPKRGEDHNQLVNATSSESKAPVVRKPKSLADIPEELINEVFKLLDSITDISRLTRVGKVFHRIGLPYLFEDITLGHQALRFPFSDCNIHSFVNLIAHHPEVLEFIDKTNSLSINNFRTHGCNIWLHEPVQNIRDLVLALEQKDPPLARALYHRLGRFDKFDEFDGEDWEKIWMAILGVLFHKTKWIHLDSMDDPIVDDGSGSIQSHSDIFRGFLVPPGMPETGFSLNQYHVTHLSLSGRAIASTLGLLFECGPGHEFQALVSLTITTDSSFEFPETETRVNLKHLKLQLMTAYDCPVPEMLYGFKGLESFELFLADETYGWGNISGVLQMHEKTLKWLTFDQYHQDRLIQNPAITTGSLLELENLEVIVSTAESLMMNPERDIASFTEEVVPASIKCIRLEHRSIFDGMLLRFIASQLGELTKLKYVILDWTGYSPKTTELEDILTLQLAGVRVIRDRSWPDGLRAYNEGFPRQYEG